MEYKRREVPHNIFNKLAEEETAAQLKYKS